MIVIVIKRQEQIAVYSQNSIFIAKSGCIPIHATPVIVLVVPQGGLSHGVW